MSVSIQKIAPHEIEAESFRIIEQELGPHTFAPKTFAVIQRVIHATGDFSFAENMRFTSKAIERGLEAVRSGKTILTDVTMVATAISKGLLKPSGNRVICRIADEDVAEAAKAGSTTRAEAAMIMGMDENTGIVAIGNAPTALLKVIDLAEALPENRRPLIIGVPVGFVNAAESKQLLSESGLEHITSLGRKGGSPVAAAIVNALIRLAGK